MQANPLLTELETLLGRWIRWLRLRRAVAWLTRGMLVGMALSLIFALAALLRGEILRSEFGAVIAVSSVIGSLAGGLAGFLKPVRDLPAARYFDLTFELKERTSTALEQANLPLPEGVSTEITHRQLSDAVQAARPVKPHSRLPIRVPWQELALVVLLLSASLLAAWRGEALFQTAQLKRAVRDAILEEASRVEAIRAEIEADPSLSPAQREALTRPLEQAMERLEQAETPEQAVSALTAAQEELRSLSDPQAQAQARALSEAGRALSEDQPGPLSETGRKLAGGDNLQAAQQLGQIDAETLTGEQLEDLADQLEETAAGIESTNPELADQLRQAAQAARTGDREAASEALQNAAQSLSQTGQEIIQAQTAGEAANELGEGQQRVIQAGRGQQATAQQDAGAQPGEGQGGSAGQGEGQNGGTGQEDGQAGDAGRGEGGQESGPGSEVGEGPAGQQNAPGDAGERPYEQIYAPHRLGGEAGQDVSLPGSGAPGDEVTGQGNIPNDSPSTSQVPYVEVFPQYEDAAYQALDQNNYPPFLRSLVKKYFSGLEP